MCVWGGGGGGEVCLWERGRDGGGGHGIYFLKMPAEIFYAKCDIP